MHYQVKDIEILISTMDKMDLEFIIEMFPNNLWEHVSILIINQTKHSPLESPFKNIKVINSDEIGLSNSRNLALKNASKEILLIADDDIIYKENFIESVLEGFNNSSSDVICFQYEIFGKLAKNYPLRILNNIDWMRLLNVSSAEVVLKKAVVSDTFYFDNKFGINSPFYMGEEAIFLSDIKKKKIHIGYYPKAILSHNNLTTGNKTSNEIIYYSSGAINYRIFKKQYLMWVFIKILFDLKQRKIRMKNVLKLILKAIEGKKEYLNSLNKN